MLVLFGAALPDFCKIMKSLEIVLFLDSAFDAELRQDGDHLTNRKSGELGRFA